VSEREGTRAHAHYCMGCRAWARARMGTRAHGCCKPVGALGSEIRIPEGTWPIALRRQSRLGSPHTFRNVRAPYRGPARGSFNDRP
jgi:hypothetical protein